MWFDFMRFDFLDIPKSGCWSPISAEPCAADFPIHFIDLLEGEALGFINHEIDKGDADEATAAPQIEDLGLKIGIAGAIVDQKRG